MPKVSDTRSRDEMLLDSLLGKVQAVPQEWLNPSFSQDKRRDKDGDKIVSLECLPCEDWETMVDSWRRALHWTEGLDLCLSVMLSSIISTCRVGDQLWVRVLGPPSSGKTTLCEAISVNRKYVYPKDGLRGFHSGMTDWEGKEDNSLLPKLKDKTLVTKDGDSLLTAPDRDRILAEARAAYDCAARSSFRNKASRNYEGLRFTWILCGTNSLRTLDSSELGERFLTVSIMDEIEPDVEDDILWRSALDASRSLNYESNGDLRTTYEPHTLKAMQLTGGYVGYLREHADELITAVQMDDNALRRCIGYGKFIAFMRARPSKKQDEHEEKELPARLVKQTVRLAKCLATVLNKDSVDDEVLKRVHKVTIDTAKGKTLGIVRYLWEKKQTGAFCGSVAAHSGISDEAAAKYLYFLRRIGAVDCIEKKVATGMTAQRRWHLTPILKKLYQEVML